MNDNHVSEHSNIEIEGRRKEFDLIKSADTHDLPLYVYALTFTQRE